MNYKRHAFVMIADTTGNQKCLDPIMASCPLSDMTAAEYHTVRESIGSQKEVSRRLGVDIRTVQRREAGEILITQEAARSLNALDTADKLVEITKGMRNGPVKEELTALSVALGCRNS